MRKKFLLKDLVIPEEMTKQDRIIEQIQMQICLLKAEIISEKIKSRKK